MPSGYNLDSLPVPLDPRVVLREEPAKLMAVRSYSGRWTEGNYRENESLLGKRLQPRQGAKISIR